MDSVSGFGRVSCCEAVGSSHFGRVAGRFHGPRTHSSLRHQQWPPGHPQVGQGEQRVQLRGVLRQSAVAHLHMAELALDEPERMPDLGADARLDLLHLRDDRVPRIGRVEQPAQSGSQRDMPVRANVVLRVLALVVNDSAILEIAPE